MGNYTKELEWEPDKLTTIIPPTEDSPGRVAWSGAGIVDVEFARDFASDLLKKCDLIERLNMETLEYPPLPPSSID